jgi:hypothetical protein
LNIYKKKKIEFINGYMILKIILVKWVMMGKLKYNIINGSEYKMMILLKVYNAVNIFKGKQLHSV